MNNIKDKPTIIVPWDFTSVAHFASDHAFQIGKHLNKDICLLHVIPRGSSPQKRAVAMQSIKRDAQRNAERYNIRVRGVVREGTIFSTISSFAEDENAAMIIMGTHGIKGMQKVTGSWALKVIAGSQVPFIVIQDKPLEKEKFTNIVFPVDFKSENKEKLYWAIFLGKYFNSRIHLYVKNFSDRSLQKKVNTNLNFAIKFLIQNNLEYHITEAPKKHSFYEETIAYAQQISADLILITTTKHLYFGDYLLGAPEQQLIANNARIPVMCVNPKANFARSGQFMYG